MIQQSPEHYMEDAVSIEHENNEKNSFKEAFDRQALVNICGFIDCSAYAYPTLFTIQRQSKN